MEGRFVYGDDIYQDEYYFDEVWEHIDSFPDYMVSNKGRVWSSKTQRFMKIKPMDNHGHLGVCLHQNGQMYYRYIHRLVAEAFIPNPDNFPIVRHLDDLPWANEVEDLAWGTKKDNQLDSVRNGTAYFLTDEDREKGFRKSRRPLIAINLKTGEKINFRSQGEAGRALGIPQANIWKVVHGERPQAQGYFFKEV